MSRRGHYVPLSQAFNDDPEAWELTDTFGDRAIRVWIEILRIMEETENHWRQVDGWPASLSRKVRQSPATVQRIAGWMLAKGWLEVEEVSANGSPEVLRARNYWKYHKRRETDKIHTPPQVVSLLPLPPSSPSEPNLKKVLSSEPEISVVEFVDSWNSYFNGKLPSVRLPLATSRQRKVQARLRDHPELEFWKLVFGKVWNSSFLMGRNGSSNSQWKASFDWIISNDTNVLKVSEGNYDNKN